MTTSAAEFGRDVGDRFIVRGHDDLLVSLLRHAAPRPLLDHGGR